MKNESHDDYMGVIELKNYVTTTPIYCAGTTVDSNSVTEISIFEASFDSLSKTHVKKSLLARFRLSDSNFGVLISTPEMSPGVPVTLEEVKNTNLIASSQALDITRNALSNAKNEILTPEKSALPIFQEIISKTKNITSKTRVSKSDTDLLSQLTQNLSFRLKEGNVLKFDNLNKELNATLSDSSANIESLLADKKELQKTLPKTSVKSTQNNFPNESDLGLLAISTSTISENLLFSDINSTGRVASLTLSFAEFKGKRDIRSNEGIVNVHLSLDNYVKLLRAKKTDVPCTIKRKLIDGKLSGTSSVKIEHTNEFQNLDIDTLNCNSETNDVIGKLTYISARIKNNEFNTPKKTLKLLSEFESILKQYESQANSNQNELSCAIDNMVAQSKARALSLLNHRLGGAGGHVNERALAFLGAGKTKGKGK